MSEARNDGGPAFPAQHFDLTESEHGLSIRDYFAAKALQGLLANSEPSDHAYEDTQLRHDDYAAYCSNWAESAYMMAHAESEDRMTARCTNQGGCNRGRSRCATPWHCGLYDDSAKERAERDMPIHYLGPEEEEEEFERSLMRDVWITVALFAVIVATGLASAWLIN